MKIKHFEVDQLIGEGSFGKVYKCTDVRNGNTVAMKIDTSNLKVLRNEVNILNYLYRNNVYTVPKIFWYGNIRDNLILIMTYYKNNLQDYFEVKGVISATKLSSVMIKCLDILRQLANLQVVHRDIKPQNFMMNDGKINLIDFGLSTIYNKCDASYNNNTDIVGTPRFTSYYSHCGEPASPRDDIISLGYMYLYLNTGSLNWDEIARNATILPMCDINHPDNLIRRQLKSPDVLLRTLPDPIQNYMRYCYSLNCDDTPDYHSLMLLFIS